MASNILSIGQSALSAAQVGISTTGHNIANASNDDAYQDKLVNSILAGIKKYFSTQPAFARN